ncbi:MAG: glycosyltransferase family 4 protein [Balneola sp.]
MKVLMVLDQKFPPDLRVEKEASSLLKAGYEVSILSMGDYDKSETVTIRGVKVYRVALSKFIGNKMHGLAAMIPWLDIYVANQVLKIFRTNKYDVIHVHDLYLFGAVKILRKKLKAIFIGDLHENYIDALRDYKWSTTYPNKLFISFKKWEKKEKEWLQLFDHLIAVNEGMRQKNILKGVNEKDITVVANSIDTKQFDEYGIDQSIIEKFKPFFTLIYIGGFISNRGLEHVIKGMVELKNLSKKIRLVLVGDGEMRETLGALSKEYEVEDVVMFEGFQSQEKIKSYLLSSDIGLVPFKRTPQTDNSSSNKLYQYMYYGLPILATNCTSVKKMVEENNCGVVYEDGDSIGFSKHVTELFKDPERIKKYSVNGINAVENKLNWKIEEDKLISIYDSLKA